MMLYSSCKYIADVCDEWIKENNAKNCTYNVVTFLIGEGLLDENKCKAFISKIETNGDKNDKDKNLL